MEKKNFFEGVQLPAFGKEHFEELCEGAEVKLERIISNAHTDPDGSWYDQELDEWVMLLKGEAKLFFEGKGEISLKEGDYLFIPARQKHRLIYTSAEPNCFWLAIHGKIKDHS